MIDYMVMEAVCLKVRELDRLAEEDQKKAEWKREQQARLKSMVKK